MEESKPENNSANHAHDQETQTTFDMNLRERREPSLHGTPVLDRRLRGYNHRYPQSWGAAHSYYRNTYPDYYHYDMPYPPPPPPPALPPALHSSHYYPGRTPHWHNPPSPVPPHLSQIQRAHSPYPQYMFHHLDGCYQQHPPTRGTAPAMQISHERRHTDTEIARPKAEWPPGYQPPIKPTLPSDYLASLHRNVASEYGGPPSTAASLRSTVIDLPHSNFSSPRHSARKSRKRALSNTPSSVESIDLNALIRGSPDSLLGYLGPARVSSAGSFGHLSPIGFCTSPGARQPPHYNTARSLFITPPPIPQLRLPTPSSTRDAVPSSTTGAEGAKEEVKEEPLNDTESLPVNKEPEVGHLKDEGMDVCHLDSTTSPGTSEVKASSDNEAEEGPAEQEERDLCCHWKDCPAQFDSQEALVNHVNSDHIKRERKDFTCYWESCNREKKPFKAQYMLVVHMRRHTGEKPHKCTYEGCTKAYSRLENLKTHLRSHTGERPYVCEVEGCNKAFSNASDRAKHQNRTHSSVKPYVCKVPGCPKRYTDPSSLRKHTKTVHGEQAIKRLKAEGSREKPPSNPDKKGSSPSEKGPSSQDPTSNPRSTFNTTSNQLQEPSKSPATNSSGAMQNGSCSQTFASSCCEGDTVSSSCDRTPGGLDIPSSQGSPRSIGQSTIGLSPRSPPFVNHLPDILEGDWEPTDNGAVTTVQSVVNVPHPQSVNLPKIDNHKRDVAQWVNDVHRRMSESSRRSSEGSHLSVEMSGDISRRSSQESGWSSYNGSRRSSQASPFPNTSLPRNPQEMTPYSITGPVLPQLGMSTQCRPYLHPLDGSEDLFRRTSETSTCSNLSAPHNRLSRNSSGYGSQSNLAVIRSPMFHKIPPAAQFSLQQRNYADSTNRRKSDTIICEADSSGVYLPKNGKGELRRSSEPVGNMRGGAAVRLDPPNASINRGVTPMENVNESELISDELDAFFNPQGEGQLGSDASVQQAVLSPMPGQTQRLCHFPYPEEQQQQQQQNLQQPTSQTVHHRPQPGSICPEPNPQRQVWEDQVFRGTPLSLLNGLQVPRSAQSYWPQQRFRAQQPPSKPAIHNGFYTQGFPPAENGAYNTAMHPSRQKGYIDMGNYEDAMIKGMGQLSTNSNGGVSEFVGNGNMVVNDMNTLLTSLLEEEKYLELQQSTRGMAGSAMSIF